LAHPRRTYAIVLKTHGAELLKQLRHVTSASVSRCLAALEEAEGDYEKALDIVRSHRRSLTPREERAGKIMAYVHQDRIGVLVEVRCATDFVARTDQFQTLCWELALQVAGVGEEDLLRQPYMRDPGRSIKDLFNRRSLHENVYLLPPDSGVTRYCWVRR
jgi:elongation factor Ts